MSSGTREAGLDRGTAAGGEGARHRHDARLQPAYDPWLAVVDGRTVVFGGRTNRPPIPWVVATPLALDRAALILVVIRSSLAIALAVQGG